MRYCVPVSENPVAAGRKANDRCRYSFWPPACKFKESVARYTSGASAFILASACRGVSPGSSLPRMRSHHQSRSASALASVRRIGSHPMGMATSYAVSTSRPVNQGGVMPIIVNRCRFSRMVLPTITGSLAKWRFQKPWLITATGPARPPPCRSSSGVNTRPRMAGTPRTWKKSPLAQRPSAKWLSPPAARSKRSSLKARAPEKACW